MNIIYESLPTMPPLAATIVIVCIYIMLAGLAILLAAKAVMKLVDMILDAIEADKTLAQLQRSQDADALNYWIRDSFYQKRLATETHAADMAVLEAERHRADQAIYDKRQLLTGAENMAGGKV